MGRGNSLRRLFDPFCASGHYGVAVTVPRYVTVMVHNPRAKNPTTTQIPRGGTEDGSDVLVSRVDLVILVFADVFQVEIENAGHADLIIFQIPLGISQCLDDETEGVLLGRNRRRWVLAEHHVSPWLFRASGRFYGPHCRAFSTERGGEQRSGPTIVVGRRGSIPPFPPSELNGIVQFSVREQAFPRASAGAGQDDDLCRVARCLGIRNPTPL